jgi:tRNA pseudouridine38-40 synthase
MRYFLQLSYNGTRFSGWQRQPNALSVQQKIEDVFALLLRQPTEIYGCGRTDRGVHARLFFAHFDFDGEFPAEFPKNFLNRANELVGDDILLANIFPVAPDAHARFDAYERHYEYNIRFRKDIFLKETTWVCPRGNYLDLEKLHQTAALLEQYTLFAPFCKTHSDAPTMRCENLKANWVASSEGLIFNISAHRFLRGMVRLIVGASVQIASGQLDIGDVENALETQTPLVKSLSVPSSGLLLTQIHYPFDAVLKTDLG